jgi:hypothetical protein
VFLDIVLMSWVGFATQFLFCSGSENMVTFAGMGKCRKRSKRSTGYPYRANAVSSHIHIVRPKVRSDGTAPIFLGKYSWAKRLLCFRKQMEGVG